jgi:hypothetical protein
MSAAVVADAPPQQEMVAANRMGQPQVTTTTTSHLLFRVEACTLSTWQFFSLLNHLVVDEHKTILEEVPREENGTISAANYAGNGSINDDDATLYQGGDVLPNRSASIFENDLASTGKAMQQLLRVLGFQIGTTRTWCSALDAVLYMLQTFNSLLYAERNVSAEDCNWNSSNSSKHQLSSPCTVLHIAITRR